MGAVLRSFTPDGTLRWELHGAFFCDVACADPANDAADVWGVQEQVKDRLILGENISQAAQFIESGACDIGIIALSLAAAPAMKSKGTYWEVPAEAHPALEQGAVILKQSKNQEAARAFLEFIKGPNGQENMKRYGFVVPSPK